MDPAEPWQTKRLLAEPLTPDHAMAMHGVISDPSMHEFMGGTPLGLGELTKRYQVLARRRSPDGTEIWCNWALREMSSGELVGTVQATLPAGGPGLDVAKVAWEVGPDFQGRGLASEAAAALVERLLREHPKIVGLSVPGMVTGSPGMEGGTPEHYQVLAFDARGKTTVFSKY